MFLSASWCKLQTNSLFIVDSCWLLLYLKRVFILEFPGMVNHWCGLHITQKAKLVFPYFSSPILFKMSITSHHCMKELAENAAPKAPKALKAPRSPNIHKGFPQSARETSKGGPASLAALWIATGNRMKQEWWGMHSRVRKEPEWNNHCCLIWLFFSRNWDLQQFSRVATVTFPETPSHPAATPLWRVLLIGASEAPRLRCRDSPPREH